MDEVQATAVAPPRVRRRHSPGFRSEVINAAKQPGTSFSAGCWILGGNGVYWPASKALAGLERS
jgi:transposase-like protein